MRHSLKKMTARLLVLVMVFSCLSITAFAAGEVEAEVVTNTIRGKANTDNFSTLKEHIDSDLTVPGDPVTYTGHAVIKAEGGTLDASNAKIEIAEGDGYFPYQLTFNGSVEDNITANPNGALEFVMNTGDLTWNNFGYPVQEGGSEWSGQGGDLNGQYHIRLKVSGLTCDGKGVEDVYVMVYVYIYGREFSDMASPQNPGSSMWGTGSLGEAVLPFAAQNRKSENAVTLETDGDLVWAWDIAHEGEDEGYSPADTAGEIMLCDLATDNLYITWPSGVDASGVTADNVAITLTSMYGETKVLVPGGDEHVTIDRDYPAGSGNHLEIPGGDYAVYKNPEGTQISINYVHWLVYPVFSEMTVDIDVDGKVYSETFAIDSAYVYTVQTGGGLDLDKTVTVQNIYGIANIDQFETSDFFTNSYSYYASSQPIKRPDTDTGSVYGIYTGTLVNKGGFEQEWTLNLNQDGTYHLHQYFAMMGQENDWYGDAWDINADGWVSLGPVGDGSSGQTGSGWGDGGISCWLVDTGSKTILERDEDFVHYTAPAAGSHPDSGSGSGTGTYTGTLVNKGGFEQEWTLNLNQDGTYHLHQYFAMMGQENDWYGDAWDINADGWVSLGAIDTANSSGMAGTGWGDNGESCWLVDAGSKTILERDEDFVHFTAPAAPVALAAAPATMLLAVPTAQSDADYAGAYTGVVLNGGGMEITWTMTLTADGVYVLTESGMRENTYTGSSWTATEKDGVLTVNCGPLDADSTTPMGTTFDSANGYTSEWYIDLAKSEITGYKDNGGSGGGASGGSGGEQGGTQQGGTQQGGTQSGGSGISLSGLLFLAWNEDGTYYATEDKNDPNILTSFPNYIPEPELLYNGYFYYSGSASIQALKDDTIECEYNGETYTFSRKVNISTSKKEGCLGTVNLEKLGAELLPGFAPSAGNGMGGGFMNIGWAVFLRSSTNEGGLNSEPDIGWTVTDYNLPFTDVTKYGSHEYVMVAWAYENGIVNGTGNGTTFESNAALTRAQAVTLLWRAAKSPAAAGSANPFTDVAAGRYYTEAVLWAVDKGIVLGDGATTFEPDRAVSHEEFVLMLHRFAGAGGNAVAWAAENGIADVAESLGGVCSRFQAVAYLYRYMGN